MHKSFVQSLQTQTTARLRITGAKISGGDFDDSAAIATTLPKALSVLHGVSDVQNR